MVVGGFGVTNFGNTSESPDWRIKKNRFFAKQDEIKTIKASRGKSKLNTLIR